MRDLPVQLASIERRESRLRDIGYRVSDVVDDGTVSSSPNLTDEPEPDEEWPRSLHEHHSIGRSTRRHFSISEFLQEHGHDPAAKVCTPKIACHLIY